MSTIQDRIRALNESTHCLQPETDVSATKSTVKEVNKRCNDKMNSKSGNGRPNKGTSIIDMWRQREKECLERQRLGHTAASPRVSVGKPSHEVHSQDKLSSQVGSDSVAIDLQQGHYSECLDIGALDTNSQVNEFARNPNSPFNDDDESKRSTITLPQEGMMNKNDRLSINIMSRRKLQSPPLLEIPKSTHDEVEPPEAAPAKSGPSLKDTIQRNNRTSPHSAIMIELWSQREKSVVSPSHMTRRSPASVTSCFFDNNASDTNDNLSAPSNQTSLPLIENQKREAPFKSTDNSTVSTALSSQPRHLESEYGKELPASRTKVEAVEDDRKKNLYASRTLDIPNTEPFFSSIKPTRSFGREKWMLCRSKFIDNSSLASKSFDTSYPKLMRNANKSVSSSKTYNSGSLNDKQSSPSDPHKVVDFPTASNTPLCNTIASMQSSRRSLQQCFESASNVFSHSDGEKNKAKPPSFSVDNQINGIHYTETSMLNGSTASVDYSSASSKGIESSKNYKWEPEAERLPSNGPGDGYKEKKTVPSQPFIRKKRTGSVVDRWLHRKGILVEPNENHGKFRKEIIDEKFHGSTFEKGHAMLACVSDKHESAQTPRSKSLGCYEENSKHDKNSSVEDASEGRKDACAELVNVRKSAGDSLKLDYSKESDLSYGESNISSPCAEHQRKNTFLPKTRKSKDRKPSDSSSTGWDRSSLAQAPATEFKDSNSQISQTFSSSADPANFNIIMHSSHDEKSSRCVAIDETLIENDAIKQQVIVIESDEQQEILNHTVQGISQYQDLPIAAQRSTSKNDKLSDSHQKSPANHVETKKTVAHFECPAQILDKLEAESRDISKEEDKKFCHPTSSNGDSTQTRRAKNGQGANQRTKLKVAKLKSQYMIYKERSQRRRARSKVPTANGSSQPLSGDQNNRTSIPSNTTPLESSNEYDKQGSNDQNGSIASSRIKSDNMEISQDSISAFDHAVSDQAARHEVKKSLRQQPPSQAVASSKTRASDAVHSDLLTFGHAGSAFSDYNGSTSLVNGSNGQSLSKFVFSDRPRNDQHPVMAPQEQMSKQTCTSSHGTSVAFPRPAPTSCMAQEHLNIYSKAANNVANTYQICEKSGLAERYNTSSRFLDLESPESSSSLNAVTSSEFSPSPILSSPFNSNSAISCETTRASFDTGASESEAAYTTLEETANNNLQAKEVSSNAEGKFQSEISEAFQNVYQSFGIKSLSDNVAMAINLQPLKSGLNSSVEAASESFKKLVVDKTPGCQNTGIEFASGHRDVDAQNSFQDMTSDEGIAIEVEYISDTEDDSDDGDVSMTTKEGDTNAGVSGHTKRKCTLTPTSDMISMGETTVTTSNSLVLLGQIIIDN